MTMTTSKRLAYLEKITSDGSTDPFAWYGLALEYRNAERYAEALETFEALRAKHPGYTAMFLMCGQMLADAGRSEAREWLEAGVKAATAKRDSHALGELEAALDALG